MPMYNVSIPYLVYVNVKVEAKNEEEAEELGLDESFITNYCGNGGNNKLIGVIGEGVSIEPTDEFFENEDVKIEVTKLPGYNS